MGLGGLAVTVCINTARMYGGRTAHSSFTCSVNVCTERYTVVYKVQKYSWQSFRDSYQVRGTGYKILLGSMVLSRV